MSTFPCLHSSVVQNVSFYEKNTSSKQGKFSNFLMAIRDSDAAKAENRYGHRTKGIVRTGASILMGFGKFNMAFITTIMR